MSQALFEIQGRKIGQNHPAYIIAELSANHNQDYQTALEMVVAAKEAGADAIKLQTYTADTLTIPSSKDYFKIQGGTLWDGKTLHDLYQEAYTPWEWQPKLKEVADRIGIHLFSSPFDSSAVDYLEKMSVPAYKIASCEIVDLPLIEKVASTGKPLILSTGMATKKEIEEAVSSARHAGCQSLALLKCTSAYPAKPEEFNLNTIQDMAQSFNVPIGISDHSLGIHVSIAAVAIGASLVERHFTLSNSKPSPDSAFSLEPDQFKQLVQSIREVEKAKGKIYYGVSPDELKSKQFRRSLFIVEDIKSGETFTEKNLRSIRPDNGLHTRYYKEVLGRKASEDIPEGTPLSWQKIQ